ncbi:hypothetical protein [Streptomyces rubellomurinus]|uniref:hypothetical protein n=1 Tax=Streptomyces rubellomurinus (strain ATCC 31215) TaxID=359131 RepID=UPI00099B5637|nr:hypothetical protein [Streptomyces rubellomurinus]
MRIHRSAHARNFTVLPNAVLQYRQLSYTARGLLADLLSRPDGWREDGRHMADTSPQGRGAIRKALKELTDAGFYRVEKIRMPDGTIRTETHVYDTPWFAPPPSTTPPAPGEAATGRAVALVKDPEKEPTLPDDDAQLREAVATLFRVIRPEPRLRLGEAEARELAPLVAQWLERGSTPTDLAHALLPGLPTPLHSAAAVLRYRLAHKLPPARPPAAARYAECARCHDPVPRPGICRACAGLGTPAASVRSAAATATVGAARARALLHAAKAGFGACRPEDAAA